MPRYKHRPEHTTYSQAEIDDVLNEVLVATTEARFLGMCDRIAGMLGVNGDNIRRLVWGLAAGTRGYTPTGLRVPRNGTPITWADVAFVKWATGSKSAEAKRQRDGYGLVARLMVLLQRNEAEVVMLTTKHGPAAGRVGFGL